jgi:hypothetical protein
MARVLGKFGEKRMEKLEKLFYIKHWETLEKYICEKDLRFGSFSNEEAFFIKITVK